MRNGIHYEWERNGYVTQRGAGEGPFYRIMSEPRPVQGPDAAIAPSALPPSPATGEDQASPTVHEALVALTDEVVALRHQVQELAGRLSGGARPPDGS